MKSPSFYLVPRYTLGLYAVLVIWGSLYPLSGWRDLGISPFSFLSAPLPQYWQAKEVLANVILYMPLGGLGYYVLYQLLGLHESSDQPSRFSIPFVPEGTVFASEDCGMQCKAQNVDGSLTPSRLCNAAMRPQDRSQDSIFRYEGYIPFGYEGYKYSGLLNVTLCSVLPWIALSCGLEALQTYLPDRVASNVDLLANTLGALLGVLFSIVLMQLIRYSKKKYLGKHSIHHINLGVLQSAWFRPHTSGGIILLGLWLLAQAAPQPMLFAGGDISRLWLDYSLFSFRDLFDPLSQFLWDALNWQPEPWLSNELLLPQQRLHLEILCTGSTVLALGLFLLTLLKTKAPRLALMLLLLTLALLIKNIGYWLLLPSYPIFQWLTPGAFSGLLLGIIWVAVLSLSPERWLVRLALCALAISILSSLITPSDQYFEVALQAASPRGWLFLEPVLVILSISWPYLTIIYLLQNRMRNRLLNRKTMRQARRVQKPSV